MIGTLLAVIAVSLALSAVLACYFFALRDFSLNKLEDIAHRNGGMAKLQPIVEDPQGHARAFGFLKLITDMMAIAAITLFFTPLITANEFSWAAVNWPNVLGAVSAAAALLFLTTLLVPISIAEYMGERLLHASPGFVRAVYVVTRPVTLLGFIDVAVKRLAGEAATTERDEIEDEIISAASEGERGGHFGAAEREMIRAVVELGDTTVDEIMTPRTEIEGIELTDDLDAIKAFIKSAGHSRIPVYEDDLDHIRGMLYAKDLISFAGVTPDSFSLLEILRAPVMVPESKRVSELLPEMQRDKIHLAIVVDEYGGTSGLVTLEDIVEEIVGEIQDEYEPAHEQDPEIQVDEASRTADADARVNVSDANGALRVLRIEVEESDDYDTLGGWVLAHLGHIPVVGETFEAAACSVEVLEAEPTRIHRIRIIARAEEVGDESRGARDDAPLDDGGGGEAGGGDAVGDGESGDGDSAVREAG